MRARADLLALFDLNLACIRGCETCALDPGPM